jgi:uncharacterized protein (DUF305 family)
MMKRYLWSTVAGALALVAVVAAGRTAPTTAQPGPMHGGAPAQRTGDEFDRTWLQEMIMHHAMAVMMAQPVVERARMRSCATSPHG